jgi:carboxymethylenebutenolidase
MCHPDAPPGRATPDGPRLEVQVTVSDQAAMPALLCGESERPPVLVVADVFGRSPFYENLAGLIAAAVFQALVPDFFFREGRLAESSREAAFARPALLDEARAVDDLAAALTFLRERSGRQRVGTVGFCMGGTFALDLASSEEDLVTVAYYGFPVPQTNLTMPPPRPIDLVESQSGPVLAFWGEKDEAVGAENVAAYVELASASNPQFAHQVVPGLGHGFLGSADLADPDDAGAATWRRAVSHLQSNLA